MIKLTFNKFSNKCPVHSKLTTCQVPDRLCRWAVQRYLCEIRYLETREVICNTGHSLPEIFHITVHNLYLHPLVCTTRLNVHRISSFIHGYNLKIKSLSLRSWENNPKLLYAVFWQQHSQKSESSIAVKPWSLNGF